MGSTMGSAVGSAAASPEAARPTELGPGFVFDGHTSWVWSITSVGGGEGVQLVSSSDDGYVCIWDGQSSRRFWHGGMVFCVKVFEDPEGRLLVASTGADGYLKVSRYHADIMMMVVLSFAAVDALLFYAAPSHPVFTTGGEAVGLTCAIRW
jgi:WD40 repeat protein